MPATASAAMPTRRFSNPRISIEARARAMPAGVGAVGEAGASSPCSRASLAAAAREPTLPGMAETMESGSYAVTSDAASAVVCTLALRIGASLPEALDGVVTRCPLHERADAARFDKDEFVRRVAEHTGCSIDAAERMTRGVFLALRSRLLDDDVHMVGAHLPRGLKQMCLGGG